MVHFGFPVVIGDILPRDAQCMSGIPAGQINNMMAIYREKIKGIWLLIQAEANLSCGCFMGKRRIAVSYTHLTLPTTPYV